MINPHLDQHQADEDRWLERRIEKRREEERFQVPTDAQVLARLPHDKRGVPIVCGCLVEWCGQRWTVYSVTITGAVIVKQFGNDGERSQTTAAAMVEVVDFGKPYFSEG